MRLRLSVAVSAVALVAAACGSGSHPSQGSTSPSTTSASGSSTTSPGGAMPSGPGVTSSEIVVGNVATLGGPIPGLFKGAPVGVQAYFDYVNSKGGIDGHRLALDSADDALQCAQNTAQTKALLPDVLAFVGSFSLFDNCGGLAIPPTVANVSNSLNASVTALPNTFSPQPMVPGWASGPLIYFKQHYPTTVLHVGALVGNYTSAETSWNYEQHAMQTLGYRIAAVVKYSPLQTTFTSSVIRMQQAGVQMVVLDQADAASIARFLQAMQLQGWHPPLVVSAGVAYTDSFIQQAGEAAAATIINDQHQALYLGTDAKAVPEVAAFDHWVQVASPGFTPDIFTVFGWASAMLFVQAAEAAAPHLTRATLLAQLRKSHSFNANGLIATSDPAAKTPATCWIFARVVNGNWQRFDSPPAGFICSGGFIRYPGG